ncbi:MAG: glycosyltransferase [Magnetococcales bacterium]|nr:glycosyltransferase [Magnetococcales bacterium]
MSRICLYYRALPEQDRWIPGDRHIRPYIRRLIRGPQKLGGVDWVFVNLCKGLDQLGIPYEVNLPYEDLRADDRIGCLGKGRNCLDGYDRPFPILAGIGLMSHPLDWPELFTTHPIVRYLAHCEWARSFIQPFMPVPCDLWPVGIDTDFWAPPAKQKEKEFDILIYNKLLWNIPQMTASFLDPIRNELAKRNLRVKELVCGSYTLDQYKEYLQQSRGLLFISAHETQGLALQEGMACDVPVLVWNPGKMQDPQRFSWNLPDIDSETAPFFDERCGEQFIGGLDFAGQLDRFMEKLDQHQYAPRDYMLENLTLKRCSQHFVDLLDQVQAEQQ